MTEARPAARAVLRLLERDGRLPGSEAARMTALAATSGLGIQALLEREGVITEKALAALLADKLHLRLLDPATVPVDPAATEALRENIATQHEVVPVRFQDGVLEIATANPLDFEGLKAVEFATGRRLRPVVATRSAVLKALARVFHGETAAPTAADDESPDPVVAESPSPAPVPAITASEEPSDVEALPEHPPEHFQPSAPPPAVDDLRALVEEVRRDQHAAIAELRAAVTDASAMAEEALGGVDTITRNDPTAALDLVRAAVTSLRNEIAELHRRQEQHTAAATNAMAEATAARETAAQVVRRMEAAARRQAELKAAQPPTAALAADLMALRSTVEELVASRSAPAPTADPTVPLDLLREKLDALAAAFEGHRELASGAATAAALAMRQGEKALLRIEDAVDPLGAELRALRAGFGELRAAQTRHEAAVERRVSGAETRSESSLTSLSERIDHLGQRLRAQELAAENGRVEAALTRQRAAEALHVIEILDALRADLAPLESRVEQRTEASIETAAARLAAQTDVLRQELETLAARVRDTAEESRWLATLNPLLDRLAALAEMPSRALDRLGLLLARQ